MDCSFAECQSNAFAGVDADLEYTCTKAGLEQDVILRQQPPAPGAFSLNSQNTKLQMLTEFFNPPQPTITATPSGDEELNLGTMEMVRGRAFLTGTNGQGGEAPVNKSWQTVQGRQILVEQVPLQALAKDLSALPQTSGNQSFKPNGPLYAVSSQRLLPTQHLGKTGNGAMILAKATPQDKGLVMDYQTVGGRIASYTFQGGTTYEISGPAYPSPSATITIEGGAVLKFPLAGVVYIDNGFNWQFLSSSHQLPLSALRYQELITEMRTPVLYPRKRG